MLHFLVRVPFFSQVGSVNSLFSACPQYDMKCNSNVKSDGNMCVKREPILR